MNTTLVPPAEHPLLLTSESTGHFLGGTPDNAAPSHCLLWLKHLILVSTFLPIWDCNLLVEKCLRHLVSPCQEGSREHGLQDTEVVQAEWKCHCQHPDCWGSTSEQAVTTPTIPHTLKQAFSTWFKWSRLRHAQGHCFPNTAGPCKAGQHSTPSTGFGAQYEKGKNINPTSIS